MPRARSPARDLAYKLWLESGKTRELKDIADELGVSASQVRNWKNLDNWENGCATNKTIDCATKKQVRKIAEKVTENKELTDQQKLFCTYFIKSFNATSSYQKAYGCSYTTAMTNGSRLLRNARITDEIKRLKQERYTRALLSPDDIFQKYMDIAFADMGDYMTWGQEEVPVMGMYGPVTVTNEAGEKETLTQVVNTVRLKESHEIDTTLIGEVKQGRDGITVKLPDRMKALDWLASHMDMATAEQKAKTEKLIAETERLKAGGAGSQDNEFLNAWKQSIIDGVKGDES